MALGAVERSCDAGSCTCRAAFIGRYTNTLGQACTTGACSMEHVVERDQRLAMDSIIPVWKPFPPRARNLSLEAKHGS